MSDNSPPPEDQAPPRVFSAPTPVGALARLRAWFFTGIIVTAPIGITIYLTVVFIGFVDRNVGILVPERYHPESYLPFSVPGLGVLIAVAGLTLVGFLTANFLGRALIRIGERLVDRMPVIRGVYSALKQIFETVLAHSSTSFRQVVMVEYPKRGLWAIAFVTAEQPNEISRKLGNDLVGLFVPTTPNPTSGYLVYAERKDIVYLSMSVEDGIKLVVSGGVIQVPDREADTTTPIRDARSA